MTVDLDRTVSRLGRNGEWSGPAPLSTYRYAPAYVLLGDPGAGKTTAFEREQQAMPGAEFVSARDFGEIYGETEPASGADALFIDGLDEARAGSGDPRGPLGEIRHKLMRLDLRRVRISCRELDWLGENDRSNLSKVIPAEELFVLRLEPVSGEEQRRIIAARNEIPDAEAFLAEANERGIGGLLVNPQTLVLLARVVAENGEFPRGRVETFARACQILAREPNDDHRIAAPPPPPDALVEIAGHMCAVALLSGSTGFSLPEAPEGDGFVPTSRFGARATRAERAARTRLFAGVGARRFIPAHANLAAFLAARALASWVEEGLPKNRVLSLLSGYEGAPPTPLRSLAAWLAALSPALRGSLIERDPIAVLMYGDVGRFAREEKALVLDRIARDPAHLHESWWPVSAVSGLASEDMEPILREILHDPEREGPKQKLAEVVVSALRDSAPSLDLSQSLLDVSRDETRWLQVRRAALDAWISSLRDEPDRADRLRAVLAASQGGQINDPDAELLGTLLRALYPDDMEPTAVWNYLEPQSRLVINSFRMFWLEFDARCPVDHLSTHLDHLTTTIGSIRPKLRELFLEGLPARLLARALEAHGEDLDPARLLAWLSVGLNEYGEPNPYRGEPTGLHHVRRWLEEHSSAQKTVIHFALSTKQFGELNSLEYRLDDLLYRSTLPKDIGPWHLSEAVAADDDKTAKKHLAEFVRALQQSPIDVDTLLTDACNRLRHQPERLRFLNASLSSRVPEGHFQRRIERQHLHTLWQEPERELLRVVRSELGNLRANCASPQLLYALAQRYFEGHTKLLTALGGDERLTEAAVEALRLTIERRDLPSPEELVQLRSQNQESIFMWPVLIGLNDRDPEEVQRLERVPLRVALVCRLSLPALAQEAAWYSMCLKERPELVAETLVLVARALLKSGKTLLPDLHQLAHDERHAEVARRATLPLLKAFPVRAKADQLPMLDQLLWGGLRLVDRHMFLRTVRDKLGSRSMTLAQRTRWLAAGLAADPPLFLARLAEQVGASETQAASLATFFSSSEQVPWVTANLDEPAIEFLVRTIGRSFEPVAKDGVITIREEASDRVRQLITQLSGSPEPAASEALQKLWSDPELRKWQPFLEYARNAQRVVRRDASYRPPTPTRVMAALANGPPASAADLRELVLDRLERITEELRTTNTNPWEQFWNEDTKTPRHENTCRNALLELLRPRLPNGCDGQPEGQYAADRRADIRIASGKWNVPVEIKKNSRRDVWSAVRNQLLPRYTNDPATEGLGIYLVLWFGSEQTARLLGNRRPATPDEMRNRLLANLAPEERRRAAVIVMDVTPPD